MSGLMDDPNREAVGLDPAWVEGTGESDNLAQPDPKSSSTSGYRTKAELLEEAQERGLDVDESNTKAEIEEALAG